MCHLQPVDWSSGWPVMGNAGEPYWKFRKPKSDSKTIVNPVETDEFDSSKLGMQWQWQNDYKESYGQETSMGFFRLFTYALPELGDVSNLWYVPNMLLQKIPADEFTATTKLSFCSRNSDQYVGLVCMSAEYSSVGLQRTEDGYELQIRHNPNAMRTHLTDEVLTVDTLKPTQKGTPRKGRPAEMHIKDVYLRMSIKDSKVNYAYSIDGKKWKKAGGEYAMGKGRWIGSKIGFFAVDPNKTGRKGFIDIDWFRISR